MMTDLSESRERMAESLYFLTPAHTGEWDELPSSLQAEFRRRADVLLAPGYIVAEVRADGHEEGFVAGYEAGTAELRARVEAWLPTVRGVLYRVDTDDLRAALATDKEEAS